MKKSMLKRMSAISMAFMLTAGSVLYQSDFTVKAASTGTGLVAFPGAEGGGMYATGGRGYDVYIVTSLADYGAAEQPIPGTLRYGIEQVDATNGGCTIVFNVGGTITLKQTLSITGKNITIAGQTAPGDGITLKGHETNISNSENLIIRYVRFRTGAENVYDGGDSMDALWGRDNKTFIIDHCSFSWNTDECLSTYRGVDGTVQWCIISESLTVSGHSKGRHGYGGIFGGDNTTFQYNLIANHTSRNPRIGGGSLTDPTKTPSFATLQVSNNVLYNWGYYACYGGGYAYTNYMNNYLKAGLGTRDAALNKVVDAGETKKPGGFYVSGNYMDGNSAITADNSKGVINTGELTGANATTIATVPYTSSAFNSLSLVTAQACYPLVLNKAGATFPKRDAIDARVVSETKNNNGSYINTENEVGGYPAVPSSRDEFFDTDKDGIPDSWEDANGLNKSDASDSKLISGNGYSNLELYFNSLVTGVEASGYVSPNPTITLSLPNNSQYNVGQNVDVTATATANNGGSIAKVDFYNGSTYLGTDTTAPYTYTYSNLLDGTYYVTARAYDNSGNETQSSTSKLIMNNTVGTGSWTSKDIGTPGVTGSASLVDGIMTVKGAGKIGRSEGSISGGALNDATKDNFQFTYKTLTGDGTLITKLDSMSLVDNHTFSGIMFRDSLDSNAKTAALGMSLVKINSTSTWSTYLVSRATTGGSINEISETIDTKANATAAGISILTDLSFKSGPTFTGTWFKMVRSGDVFTGFSSSDGLTWTEVGSRTIDMGDTIYVGFAVDANKVANQINNLSTAKFSDFSLTSNVSSLNVKYNLTNLTQTGATTVLEGSTYATTLVPASSSYILPDDISVTVGGVASTAYTYNKTTGAISIPNVTAEVVITAVGKDAPIVTNYSPTKYDANNLLTVTAEGSVMKLNQSATSGKMPQKSADSGSNVSYLLFPQTNDVETISLKVKITNYSISGADGKYTGLFVGAFQPSNNYLFASLGFRGFASSTGTDSLSGYWIKNTDAAGNGSPKYVVGVGDEYNVTFVKNDSGYLASFEDLTNPLSVDASGNKTYKSSKQFKYTEMKLASTDTVQYGLALVGVSADITGLKLLDKNGTVLYDQADYYKDAGTAPTVSTVNAPVISQDRSSINVSWNGQGATGDGKYKVEVSKDAGVTFTTLGTTIDTSYTYKPSASGSYLFKVSGACGTNTTTGVTSSSVNYVRPMSAPSIDAVSGNAQNTIKWSAVAEATSYTVYRSTSRNGDYAELGKTSDLQYVDKTAQNEVPYFYKVSASNTDNSSNPSSAVTIMASAGHVGDYVFGTQAAKIAIVEKTNDTVLSGNATIKYNADSAGTFKVEANGSVIDTKTVAANDTVSTNITLQNGRNNVVIYFTDINGKITYKNLNFVKLTKVDVIVDSAFTGTNTDGIPTFKTVKEAIDSISLTNESEKVIFIKNGNYYEKVDVNAPNISIIGEDSDKTIICFDAAAGTTIPGTTGTYGTSGSSTVTVNPTATAFTAENITISNTFDYPNSSISGKQAVAFYDKADKSILTNVKMLGYQDTLFADGNARQYYSKCYIEGNVDYIFGNAQAVFSNCDIVSNGGGYVTAASTESNKTTGYVFINSRILAKNTSVANGTVYLGRPWRQSACVTYINCFLDSVIVNDKGYSDMSDATFKNANFFEFGSYGPGFAVNANRPQISKQQADALTINGVFACEAGTGFTYAAAWDADSSYSLLSSSYVKNAPLPADYTGVDAAIAKANALNSTDYKDFSAVLTAINAIVRDLDISSQSSVDAMANAILSAIDNLDRQIIQDTNNNAVIEDTNNYIPDKVVLKVEKIVTGDRFEESKTVVIKENNLFSQLAVFEINLTNEVTNTAVSQLDGMVKVTLPIPSGFDLTKGVSVFRVETDGKLTPISGAQVVNGKCVFSTNHFSTYVIAGFSTDSSNVTNPGTSTGSDTQGTGTNPGTSTGTGTQGTGASTGNDISANVTPVNSTIVGSENETTSPKTADLIPYGVYVFLFGLSLGVVICASRKRKVVK